MGHHGDLPLRASGLDAPTEGTNSLQKLATLQAAGTECLLHEKIICSLRLKM